MAEGDLKHGIIPWKLAGGECALAEKKGIKKGIWKKGWEREGDLLQWLPFFYSCLLCCALQTHNNNPSGPGDQMTCCWRIRSNSIPLAWVLEFSLKWPWVWWERNTGCMDGELNILPAEQQKVSARLASPGPEQSCHAFPHSVQLFVD